MNTARQGTARTFPPKPLGFSHGQRAARAVSRGTDRPAPFRQLQPPAEQHPRAPFRLISRQVIWLATGAIFIAALAAMMRSEHLVFVATDSSCPIGIYRINRRPITRDDLVEACLPDAIASYGMTRGYIGAGSCQDGAEPVIKIVAATAGDQVQLSSYSISVNGVAMPGSVTRLADTHGRSVRSIARGSYLTSPNEVWILGLHDERSWDSRYFGPIPHQSVIGAVQPVFTVPSLSRSK